MRRMVSLMVFALLLAELAACKSTASMQGSTGSNGGGGGRIQMGLPF